MKTNKVARLILEVVVIFLLVFAQNAFGQSALKILLTNDDGIDAPGLAALFDKLAPLGVVTVAASTKNESGASHGLTSEGPIWVNETVKKGNKWYAIEALPATCLRLALESLLPEKPDLVIAGINKGNTMGVVTYYSATVACAREAAFAGIPAIAVHLGRGEAMDYEGAAAFVAGLVREIRKREFKPGVFLNINIPALPKDQIRGVLITRQDLRATLEFYEKKLDPAGKLYFMRSFKLLDPAAEDTDIWALAHGYISITPLQFDQTDCSALKSLKSWARRLWRK
jgi:5'-nucleotidase